MSSPPAPKISHHNRGQPNKQEELYEEVEMHEEEQPRYMTTIHPNHVDIDDNSQIVGKISTKTKRWKCVVIALIAACLCSNCVFCGSHYLQSSGQRWRQHWIKYQQHY